MHQGNCMKNHYLSLFFLVSNVTILSMEETTMNQQDCDNRARLHELTVYKKDLYLERLLQKKIVTLKDIEEIHKEVDEGLDYHPDRLDKEVGELPNRWECAVRLAPANIKNFIEKKLSGSQKTNPCCHMILICGAFGVGKETLARGIAHSLKFKQMRMRASHLLDETEVGTSINVHNLIKNFSSQKNTALILEDVDCLLAERTKQVIPDNIRPILRPSGHKYKKNQDHRNNLLICIGTFPHKYPRGFMNEVSEIAFIKNPTSDQRLEIAQVMFEDRKMLFDSDAKEYFENNIKKIKHLSCRNLQGIVNRIVTNAQLGHSIGGRSSELIAIEDIEDVFDNL